MLVRIFKFARFFSYFKQKSLGQCWINCLKIPQRMTSMIPSDTLTKGNRWNSSHAHKMQITEYLFALWQNKEEEEEKRYSVCQCFLQLSQMYRLRIQISNTKTYWNYIPFHALTQTFACRHIFFLFPYHIHIEHWLYIFHTFCIIYAYAQAYVYIYTARQWKQNPFNTANDISFPSHAKSSCPNGCPCLWETLTR